MRKGIKKIIIGMAALAMLLPAAALGQQQTPPYPLLFPVMGNVSAGATGLTSLADYQVIFYKDTGDWETAYADALTDASGSFTLNLYDDARLLTEGVLTSGAYYIMVASKEAGGHQYWVPEAEITLTFADLTKGSKVLEADLALQVITASLEGSVVDEDGKPVPEAKVEIIDADGNIIATAETNADGTFNVEVPVGTYDIKVSIPGYYDYLIEDYVVGAGEIELEGISLVKELSIDTSMLTSGLYLPDGQVGTAYLITLEASGGNLPYTWSISSGKLPKGLTLNIKTGVISGTPTETGKFTFTIKVTDEDGRTAEQEMIIEKITMIEPSPDIRVWFDKRLYQEAAKIEEGGEKKFVVSERPDIKIEVSIEEGYAISKNISEDYSIMLNPGQADAKNLTLTTQNVQPQSAVASEEKVRNFTLEYAGKDLPKVLSGVNVFKFTAKSSGSDYGIASTGTYYATVEVVSGPLRILDVPITYPSPFSVLRNGTVYIQYSLSSDADIDLYVVDMGGQRVKKFMCDAGTEGGAAGLNKVKWEEGITALGTQLSNGIYLVTIVARQENRLLAKIKLTVLN